MPKNKGWYIVYDRMSNSPQIQELTDGEFRCPLSQGGTNPEEMGWVLEMV